VLYSAVSIQLLRISSVQNCEKYRWTVAHRGPDLKVVISNILKSENHGTQLLCDLL